MQKIFPQTLIPLHKSDLCNKTATAYKWITININESVADAVKMGEVGVLK